VTDGQADGQTDAIAIASTALAMRALRRAVKSRFYTLLGVKFGVEESISPNRCGAKSLKIMMNK